MGEVKKKPTSPIAGRASPIADIPPVPGESIRPVTKPDVPTYTQVTLKLANGILIP